MNFTRVAQILALALATALPGIVFAAPFGGPIDCVHDLILEEKIQDLALAKVTADGRVRFQRDALNCPGSDARCRSNAYTSKGDLLVTGNRRGAWICAEYPTRTGQSQGWIRSDQISAVPVPRAPGVKEWAGRWTRDGEASLRITAKSDALIVDGQAFWYGANPGQVHDGELNGQARPSGNSLRIDAGDPCKASMRLLGPYLIVADNFQCGGVNVSFSGIYRRSNSQRP